MYIVARVFICGMGELTNEHEDSERLVIAGVCVHSAGEVGILEVPVKIGKTKATHVTSI